MTQPSHEIVKRVARAMSEKGCAADWKHALAIASAAIAATGLVEEVERLRGVMEQAHDTLDQVLDDMRDDGLSVCRAVKQEIQETFETVAKALAEKPDAD